MRPISLGLKSKSRIHVTIKSRTTKRSHEDQHEDILDCTKDLQACSKDTHSYAKDLHPCTQGLQSHSSPEGLQSCTKGHQPVQVLQPASRSSSPVPRPTSSKGPRSGDSTSSKGLRAGNATSPKRPHFVNATSSKNPPSGDSTGDALPTDGRNPPTMHDILSSSDVSESPSDKPSPPRLGYFGGSPNRSGRAPERRLVVIPEADSVKEENDKNRLANAQLKTPTSQEASRLDALLPPSHQTPDPNAPRKLPPSEEEASQERLLSQSIAQRLQEEASLKDHASPRSIFDFKAFPQPLKDIASQMRPCANPWCARVSHRRDKLCAVCQEITQGVFVENMLIHLCWSPLTWRLRVSLSAAELMWSPTGTWEMKALPGSPFPVVVKAVVVDSFALGGRFICRLPPGTYSVSWRLARAPLESEIGAANKAQAIWGLTYSKQNCFRWGNPNLESRMRCTTGIEKGPIQLMGLTVTGKTVGMLPNWTEMVVGTVELGDSGADDRLSSLTLEIELHSTSKLTQGGLFVDGVVVSQIKETDRRKLFNDAARVIREAKVASAI